MLRASMGLPIKPRDGHNFKGDAPMVFDGIPSKIVPSPSEVSEFQLDGGVILANIHLEEYLISCEVLNQVFSSVGNLDGIEKIDQSGQFQWRIRFKNRDSAVKAIDFYNGRCIYDYCCRMELWLDDQSHNRAIEIEDPTKDVSRQVEEIKELRPTNSQSKIYSSTEQLEANLTQTTEELQPKLVEKENTEFNFANAIDAQVSDRTLLVKIHNETYPISCQELDKVFSRFGILENLEKLGLESEFHSKICFQNKEEAIEAFNSFNGINVYDGCCRMELIRMSGLNISSSCSCSPIQSSKFEEQDLASENLNWHALNDSVGMRNLVADTTDVRGLESLSMEGGEETHSDLLIDDISEQTIEMSHSLIGLPLVEFSFDATKRRELTFRMSEIPKFGLMVAEREGISIATLENKATYNLLDEMTEKDTSLIASFTALKQKLPEMLDADVIAELQCDFVDSFGSINSFIFDPGGGIDCSGVQVFFLAAMEIAEVECF